MHMRHETKILVLASVLVWFPLMVPGCAEKPRKVERSGLWEAVQGHVLIYIHKEQMLADVADRYPAGHYVMIDDKLRILSAMKGAWRERLTTVFPRQGHYAHDQEVLATYPAADLSVERIGDLLDVPFEALLAPASRSR